MHSPMLADTEVVERRAIRVRGTVQGVGFRPFVYRLAQELGLAGWVFNDTQGVAIEVQGPVQALQRFEQRLKSDAPPLSRVEALETRGTPALDGDAAFHIRASRSGAVKTSVPPDTATCADCLAELFDPADRRSRYAFINCTQCGPRYTLTRALPYDRATTSMARLCAVPGVPARVHRSARPALPCRAQCLPGVRPGIAPGRCGGPADPRRSDRRHAGAAARRPHRRHQGPGRIPSRLRRTPCRGGGTPAPAQAARGKTLRRDGRQPAARPCAGCTPAPPNRRLLQAAERPIVLLPMREDRPDPLAGIAPGLQVLGLMLPSTPIQFLLFHEAAGRPAGSRWLQQEQALLLVMTSANPGGEPLVIGNRRGADAARRHRRCLAAARPRHRRALRRQRAAPAALGDAAVHPPRARLHAVPDQAATRRPAACWPPAPG